MLSEIFAPSGNVRALVLFFRAKLISFSESPPHSLALTSFSSVILG